MKEYFLAFILCAGLIGIGVGFSHTYNNGGKVVGSDIGTTAFMKASSSSAQAITAASTFTLATNTARVYARIGNTNTTGAVFCSLDQGKPAVATSGVMIAAGGTLVLSPDDNDLYRGAVFCVSSQVPTAVLSVFEHQ